MLHICCTCVKLRGWFTMFKGFECAGVVEGLFNSVRMDGLVCVQFKGIGQVIVFLWLLCLCLYGGLGFLCRLLLANIFIF